MQHQTLLQLRQFNDRARRKDRALAEGIQPEFIAASVLRKRRLGNTRLAFDSMIRAVERMELRKGHLGRTGTGRLVALDSVNAGDRALPPGRLRNIGVTR